MIVAWSVDRVRAAEEAAMATLPEGELMQRAASALAEVVAQRLQERQATGVVALVGPGNNGGDALYALAQLAAQDLSVTAVHTGRVHPGAWAAAVDAGVLLVDGAGPDAAGHIRQAGLVVDGILGIGGRPGLPDWARAWVDAVDDDAYLVAVDLPSGQDPAGRVRCADAVVADETVTFGVPKPLHLLPATEAACGRLTLVDIGLDLPEPPSGDAVVRLTSDDVRELWPVPGPADDKYSRGVLGVIAGGEMYTGAALMSVATAVRSGAGMVRYVGTPTPQALVRAAVPEVVHGPGRVQAWVVGPGLDVRDRHDGTRAQLEAAHAALGSQVPVLVDAGGLDLVSGRRATPTLLTPHAGELARLVTRLRRHGGQLTAAEVAADPVGAAREAADLTGSTVLLKGSTTVVVSPTDAALPVFSQSEAPSWLATAGAGDVLAGLAGVLLASGLAPARAGALAALVHGIAADDANPGGPVHASAVADALPATVARLLHPDLWPST